MRRIFGHTILILLFAAFRAPVIASQYGDMRQEAEKYEPAFYRQSLDKAADESSRSSSFSPDNADAASAFEKATQDIEAITDINTPVSVDDMLGGLLNPETLNEYERIKALVEAGKVTDTLTDTVSLNTMLGAAVVFSPSIKSADDNLRASMNRYDQSLFLEQLLFQYLGFTESLNTKTSSRKNQSMVQMNYPFPGMVALKGNAVDKDVEIARAEYEKTVRDVLTEVKIKYAEVLYFDSVLGITRQNLQLARNIDRVALRLYETGSAEYSNVVKISIRVDKLGTMVDTFTRKKNAGITSLRETAGLPGEIEIDSFSETGLISVPEPAILQKLALSRSQELRSMQLMIERMDIMIEMGGRKLFPDYSLGFSYFQNREVLSLGTQGKAATFMTRSMGQGAMPDYASENAYLLELKDKRNSLLMKLDDMHNRTSSMVESAYANYSASRNTSGTYGKVIIGKARNSYEATLGAYTSGGGSFIDLLDAHRILLDQQFAYEDAKLMARKSLAMLEKTVGGRIIVEKGVDPQ